MSFSGGYKLQIIKLFIQALPGNLQYTIQGSGVHIPEEEYSCEVSGLFDISPDSGDQISDTSKCFLICSVFPNFLFTI